MSDEEVEVDAEVQYSDAEYDEEEEEEEDEDENNEEPEENDESGTEDNDHEEFSSNNHEFIDEQYNTFENNDDYLKTYHPEEIHLSFEEIHNLSLVTRNSFGIIIDENHKTFPILSKYEKTKLLGIRVSQLNKGAEPFIEINGIVFDKCLIAEKELKEKKMPFIIKRPIPNGKFEYWNIADLEII